MSQASKDKVRRFEQKMHDEGAAGFADGPRPWEQWDESGNQESNRIWEGSSTRINGNNKKRGSSHRLLSFLTSIILVTLLVGIGGVYFTHTQYLAQSGEQALSVADRLQPINTAPETVAVETPASIVQPVTSSSIDSVAIETVVTERSITTTVYTRHPEQGEPDIVAAIETTPPPVAHEVESTPTASTEPQPAGDTAEIETSIELAVAPPSPAEQIDAATTVSVTVTATEQESEPAIPEPVAETAPEPIEEQPVDIVEPVKPPVKPVEKTGNWVINLASYTWKSTARKKLALFGQQGVDAEIFEVLIKDKPMYRIRVTGFESSRAAKAAIPELQQTLGLEGAWISKR